MRIIFLDIDGVLNSLRSVFALGNPSKHFDPVAVGLLDKLSEEADAHIVISSSWRHGNTEALVNELYDICHQYKEPHFLDRVVGETPRLSNGVRGDEIEQWLVMYREEDIESYVIIDDDKDMLPKQQNNFVHTSFNEGFLLEHYWECMRILAPNNMKRAQYLGARKS